MQHTGYESAENTSHCGMPIVWVIPSGSMCAVWPRPRGLLPCGQAFAVARARLALPAGRRPGPLRGGGRAAQHMFKMRLGRVAGLHTVARHRFPAQCFALPRREAQRNNRTPYSRPHVLPPVSFCVQPTVNKRLAAPRTRWPDLPRRAALAWPGAGAIDNCRLQHGRQAGGLRRLRYVPAPAAARTPSWNTSL